MKHGNNLVLQIVKENLSTHQIKNAPAWLVGTPNSPKMGYAKYLIKLYRAVLNKLQRNNSQIWYQAWLSSLITAKGNISTSQIKNSPAWPICTLRFTTWVEKKGKETHSAMQSIPPAFGSTQPCRAHHLQVPCKPNKGFLGATLGSKGGPCKGCGWMLACLPLYRWGHAVKVSETPTVIIFWRICVQAIPSYAV